MAGQVLSSIVPIINGVQTQLINQLGLDSSQVRIVAHEPPFQQKGQTVLYIWPKESVREPVESDGSGRRSTVVRRTLWLVIDNRLATDDTGGSEDWLTNASLGILQFEEQVQTVMEDL